MRTALLLMTATLIFIGLLHGCRTDPPPSNWDPPPSNCLVLMVDSLRADHLGCYGCPRETSPVIDRLAREGAQFEQAFSTTSWTLPAHAALFTSLFDSVHRVFIDGRRLNGRRVTLAEALADAGYRTAGFYTGPYLSVRYGLDQGFETYESCSAAFTEGALDERQSARRAHRESHREISSPRLVERSLAWLERQGDEPFFLFLHFFDVHYDYIPPPPFDTRFDPDYQGPISPDNYSHNPAVHPGMPARDLEHLVALYDGEIAHVDAQIGRIINRLAAMDLLEDTLIVLLSDHGEEFFEHGGKGHRQTLFRESVHIPLIIRHPRVVPRGIAPRGRVRIVDVMPTILDLLDIPCPDEAMGSSLLPRMTGSDGRSLPVFCELTGPQLRKTALRRGRFMAHKDHKGQETTVYDLRRDRLEQHPLRPSVSKGGTETVGALRQWIRRTNRLWQDLPRDTEIPFTPDAELDRQLRALGYLEGEPEQVESAE